ncbi:MAG TPA: 4-hydroxy-tetrahydrodipicolinate synthase [Actinobacteria bacterium]|nr:4-hydroxy-tetrahydrodipicolinate synthase [Actinomycetota bacterium]
MADFGKVMTAMITPFNKDFDIDWKSADIIMDYLIENETDSFLIAGTTGESPTLSDKEKIELFKFAKKKLKNNIPLIAGTGSNDTRHTIELSRAAQEAGADCVLIVTPYYNKPTQNGLINHYRQISESIDIPIIFYNVPARTCCNITSSTSLKLSEFKNILGVKEASGDLRQIAEIIRDCSSDFLVYSGNDGDTFPVVALGGKGVVSVASHIIGKEIKKMINLLNENKISEAAEMHKKYLDIFYGIFITTSPIPIKKALNLMGIPAGYLRPPLCDMEKQEEEKFTKLLSDHKLI